MFKVRALIQKNQNSLRRHVKNAPLLNNPGTDEVSANFMINFWKSSSDKFNGAIPWKKDKGSLDEFGFVWLP